ncbi:hypothetical protein [Aurantiacibacter spongiae]|uniref:Uncharacterized protein n=1 Tax=Aurantiacibacter spongiae TaxID=2488860 RepID=A0A3N5DLS1_9SPHN|nr:hypothetical protein [Aurantiacibacter spongiae]RPF71755.1 hypothetical protein EG799_09095 [Aurantiacibacter spongiae]
MTSRNRHGTQPAWVRKGAERHDLTVSFVTTLLFPVCFVGALSDRGARGTTSRGVWTDALSRARSNASMITQLPG